jgi:hypothetical protein
MTKNQLAALTLQENKRHNVQSEQIDKGELDERHRSNSLNFWSSLIGNIVPKAKINITGGKSNGRR